MLIPIINQRETIQIQLYTGNGFVTRYFHYYKKEVDYIFEAIAPEQNWL